MQNKQTGLALIVIVLIVVGVLIIGGGTYYFLDLNKKTPLPGYLQKPIPSPTTSPQSAFEKILTPNQIISDLQKAALEGDVDKMVENFHISIQDSYRTAFNDAKLVGTLDQITMLLQTAQLIKEGNNYAQFMIYKIENGKKISSFINMIKDVTGTWKIKSL